MTIRTGKPTISRREFLRAAAAVSGAAALAAVLEGCSPLEQGTASPTVSATGTGLPPTGTPTVPPTQAATSQPTASETSTPTAMAEDGTARVAFVKTKERAAGVRRAVELLGASRFDGKSIFLKPNFNSADPTPGSTHPEVLTALVTLLREMGAGQITVGDRSGMGNTRAVMEQIGVFRLAEELGFDTVVFDEMAAENWVQFQPAGSHWKNGFWFSRPMLDTGAIVSTCCLKTHQYGGQFTLSLKNSVGMAARWKPGEGYDYMDELHGSARQRSLIAEINTAYSPALVVLDGVEGFISGGPAKGKRVASEVILAGTDRVAIDAVGVALLRYHGCQTEVANGRIFEQEQIARAVELGLGVTGPEKIEFVTDDADSLDYSKQIKAVLMG